MARMQNGKLSWIVAGLILSCIARVSAQQLAPRTFWPAPKGTQVAVAGYSYTFGNVLVDPSLPVSDVDSRINTGFLAYLQTFNLMGRTANFLLEQPYSWGTTKGSLDGEHVQAEFSGFDDLGVTVAVNLLGAPSMNLAEFQELRAHPRPILGASVKVVAPTGTYDKNKLINTGANRWAVRPKLGCVLPLRPKWLLEVETSAWFFGDNDDYISGKREQDPILAAELHLVKRLQPGFWASLDGTYFWGGEQTIGGKHLSDEQSNVRVGGTIVMPFFRRHAIKVGYSDTVLTKHGNDFQQFLITYQFLF